MRRAARVDANHPEIAKAFRDLGFSVKDVSQLKGFCDQVVGKWGLTACIECKDGSLPPSRRKFTEAELNFAASFKGLYFPVLSPRDVAEIERAFEEVRNVYSWKKMWAVEDRLRRQSGLEDQLIERRNKEKK